MTQARKDYCSCCGLSHKNNEDNFYKKSNGDLRSICKKCHIGLGVKRKRKQYKEIREKLRYKYYNNLQYRAYSLWKTAKDRANKKNIVFTLDRNLVEEWINEGTCSVTGATFSYNETTKNASNPYSPSLDRIVPDDGYTNENCRMVVWILLTYYCNKIITFMMIAAERRF